VTGSTRIPGALRERGFEPDGHNDFEFPLGRHAVRVVIGDAGLTVRDDRQRVLPRQAALSDAVPCALILAAIDMAARERRGPPVRRENS
jgi:hypothetical protein